MTEQGRSDTPVADLLDRAWDRSRLSLRARVRRVRSSAFLVLQSALAAGFAWWFATDVIGHQQAFFAPIVAVVCLGMSYGQRLRRVLEVAVGVAVGVFTADLFVHFVGTGPWQVTVIVIASMLIALLLDAGRVIVTQAAVQSIVVTTLVASPGQAFTRWTDALIGGGVALVAATVVPQAALRRPRVAASAVVRKMSELFRRAATSAADGDVEGAAQVLASARGTDGLLRELGTAADEGLSVLTSSPFSRGHAPGVRKMVDLVGPLDRAMRSTRVLVRRVTVAVGRGEALPQGYVDVLRELADATDVIARALAENAAPDAGRIAVERVAQACGELPRTPSLATETVLAQLRSVVVDLLQLTGMDVDEAVAAMPPERPRD
ncbi:membrane protein [Intrasporangium chromatireducens Q5-1]|uniref:Membrane protein n=1 Tax=Intrasporangium chromatireducens Q5-1 TaxID=584657 RepID=W9GNE5_9MICO|nr:FUSC family protein [Intrasporangium chromatireducens]EWT06587.1 membrane protein [Intrasporangium chromatireducens Q5-1]